PAPGPQAAPATRAEVPCVDEATLREAEHTLNQYREAYGLAETQSPDLRRKIARYVAIAQRTRVDRVRLLRELARLEQMRGNDLVACSYRLRAIRLLGSDLFRDLVWVRRTLETRGFAAEAAAADAMYGAYLSRTDRCHKL